MPIISPTRWPDGVTFDFTQVAIPVVIALLLLLILRTVLNYVNHPRVDRLRHIVTTGIAPLSLIFLTTMVLRIAQSVASGQ
jgi:hypothetical protein